MLIIPSIDLLGGRCVRLYKGDYDKSKIYQERPDKTAAGFEEAGAHWIHVVDLDAARGGGQTNRDGIKEIRKAVSCSIEVGGGIRRESDVEELLELGVDRLVLGTILVKAADTVSTWVTRYGRRFAGSIDALHGSVRIKGWRGEAGLIDTNLAERLKDLGMTGFFYTIISSDGTLSGPDLARTNRVAEHSELPVILSGGISSEGDVERVFKERHRLVKGIITGKALYERRVSLPDLIDRFQKGSGETDRETW
jgi:phosphoribosylformimino-5-aminoimidazole carboxamide ribotide isomerase